MKVRQIIILLAALGIIGLSVFGGILLSALEEPEEEKKRAVVRKFVQTAPVTYTAVPTSISAYGRLKASESLQLIAEKSGTLLQGAVPLKKGEQFAKGTLLYSVQNEEELLNLQASKSNFLSDLAAILPDMQVDFPNSYTQWTAYFNSIDLAKPLPELPTYASDKEKTFLATKNIFNAYYQIKSSEASLRKNKHYAPFRGTISELNTANGSFVSPGTPVATIKQTDELELTVAIKTEDVRWINKGAKVSVIDDKTGDQWAGIIDRIGALVNEQTQSIDVFIRVYPQAGQYLFDGMYLKAVIPGKTVNNALEIPREVLAEGSKVYTIEQDSILKVKQVRVHKLNTQTAVISGLEAGADLVMEPMINAANNQLIYRLQDAGKYQKEGPAPTASN